MKHASALLTAGALMAAQPVWLTSACAESPQGEAHVHGRATLTVIIEEKALTVEFEAPMHDLAGFEHAPKTAAEIATVSRIRKSLVSHQTVFSLPTGAQCSPTSVDVEGLEAHAESSHNHDSDEDHHGSHADVIATYAFDCANTAALAAVGVNVIRSFPAVSTIEATVISPKSQFARKLSKDNVTLQLR